jgi:predicted RNA-binding Zn ribbon-like protein
VVFAHDTESALLAAVELVNTASAPETMTTREELAGFLDRHGYTGARRGDVDELEEVRALRATLRGLLISPRDEAVARVNAMLADARAVPRLVRHGEEDWHVHAVDDEARLADRIVVETAMAMIDVIRAEEHSRFAVCADDDCDGLVLDLSRNRSRRYCSTTCGNRNAVAAYRARRHGD